MIYKKKYYAIIPARGGSTGIKRKNLIKIGGKSLVSITADFALKFNFFNKIILSSDSNLILSNIKNKKVIKDKRPKKLSGKYSQTIDTIKYLSKKFNFKENDIIFILEPTSPLRIKKDIIKAKEILKKNKANYVCSFTESWTNPYRAWKMKKFRMINFIKNKKSFLPRQKLPNFFTPTGHVIAFKLKKKIVKSIENNTSYILIDKLRGLDIDDITDYKLVKYIYENKRI